MTQTALQPTQAHILAVREGEAFARGFFEEAMGLFKASAALDPELPMLLEAMVQDLTQMGSAVPGGPEVVEFVEKHSHAPDALRNFYDKVIVVEEQARLKVSGLKTSFFGDMVRAARDHSYEAKRMAASFGGGQAPRTQGSLSWTDPIFDPTRGLRRLEDDSQEGIRMRALTPEQRKERGVFFESDVPSLAKNHKPAPRSLREATLLGVQQGVHRANTAPPSLIESAKFELQRRNAERLAFKSRQNQIHGAYPGLLGTVEEALPTWQDKLVDAAGSLGQATRRVPKGLLYAGGGLGAMAAVLGTKEYLRDREAKRQRMRYTVESPTATRVRQEAAPSLEAATPPPPVVDLDEDRPKLMNHPLPGAM